MVGIEIPNGNAADPELVMGVKRSDRDTVEITKPHGRISRGMMSGWTHEGKRRGAMGKRMLKSREHRGRGAPSMGRNIRKERCVAVEITRLIKSTQMRRRMRPPQYSIGHSSSGRRQTKIPCRMSRPEVGRGACETRRLLGAHRRTVISALRIVKNEHGLLNENRGAQPKRTQ